MSKTDNEDWVQLQVTSISDIKQAIREVLLSEEFLTAFAAAWMKTPILHDSELNLGEHK